MLKKVIFVLTLAFVGSSCFHSYLPGQSSPPVKAAYQQALYLRDKEDKSKALEKLKAIIKQYSDFYPAYKSLVNLYAVQEDRDAAVTFLKRLLEKENPYAAWALGKLREKWAEYAEALAWYKKSIEIDATFPGSYKGVVEVLLIKSQTDEHALQAGEQYLRDLLESTPGASPGAHYGLGYLFARQYRFEEALAECFSADSGTPRYPDNYDLLSEVLYYTGDFKRSLEYLNKSLQLNRKNGDLIAEANTLDHLGLVCFRLADYKQALEYFNNALSIYRETAEREYSASALNNMGLVYANLAAYPQALEYFQQALALNREFENQRLAGYSLNNIGIVYSILSNYSRALEYLEESLSVQRNIRDRRGEAMCLVNIAKVHSNLGNYPPALDFFNRAFSIQQEIGDKLGAGLSLNNISSIHTELSDYEKALEYAHKVVELGNEIGSKATLMEAYKNLGLISVGQAESTRALEYLNRAYLLAEEIGGDQSRHIILQQTGDVHLALGNYTTALSYYQQAIDILESIRGALQTQKFKIGFLEKHADLYAQTVQCLYTLHRQNPGSDYAEQAFTCAEKSKARGLLDLLAESHADIRQGIEPELLEQERTLEKEYARVNTDLQELLSRSAARVDQDRVDRLRVSLEHLDKELEELEFSITRENPHYAELKYPSPVTSEQIQTDYLREDVLLIEYKVTAGAVFAWKITTRGFQFLKLDIPEEALTEKVLALRNCITVIEEEDILSDYAAELYDLLLKPLLADTDRPAELVIIPDGILFYLPFESLITEKPAEPAPFAETAFLINSYTIRYAQSATVAWNLAGRPARGESRGLLALGDPVFSREELTTGNGYLRSTLSETARSQLKRLIYSSEEVKNISALFTGSTVYLREEATEERLKSKELQNYRYIHLATHGILNEENPRFSGVVLTQDDDPAEDGFLLTREIFNLKINADLVVLSACNTGLGKQVAGEGMLGLTRAWLYAGASSLVVSLWNIDDRSTSVLMESFYRETREGLDYSRALRRAKLALLRQETYAHPYWWAGFVLTGGNYEP